MTVPIQAPLKRHQWGWYVQYLSRNDEPRNLSGAVFADDAQTVDLYFRRKFSRVAKELYEVTVWDEGVTAEGGLLKLTRQDNGTVIASISDTGEFHCMERADGTRSTITMPSDTVIAAAPSGTTSMNFGTHSAMGPTFQYVPPPPAVVYPDLSTYKEAFDLVTPPKDLHTYGGSGFKAKFYDVFPREK